MKSKSGKDIRDLVYVNEPHVLTFKSDESFDDFMDFATNIISYFGYFSLDDLLAYYGKSYDFISSTEYGWGIEELDRANIEYAHISYGKETIYVLPPPKPINEIYIPTYPIDEIV